MTAQNTVLDSYKLSVGGVIIDVTIHFEPEESVPVYTLSILNISKTTSVILNKLREEFISKVSIGAIDIGEEHSAEDIKEKFKEEIKLLIEKYFPNIDKRTSDLLMNHVIQQNVGLGNIELLLKDQNLEEIVVNNADENVWVYHRTHGWLKTNLKLSSEMRVRHYATLIGRDVGKEITPLKPLMDAHLLTGDRVNATLSPISSRGNTITIRKFADKPWTITDFLKAGTMSYDIAAWLWLAVQNELSLIVSGGTGSGKTSALNVISNFFPPNQRLISIEDTRELTLPKQLHWVPMETRLPNPEGKGEITMLDLVVNALRMRPDRIIMGEVRRKREAEVLFEAMHTGHSVYATLHANNAEETVVRLTNPPIDIPKPLLTSIGLILVQSRNRRTGKRRSLQIAEIMPDSSPHVFIQHNPVKDQFVEVAKPTRLYEILQLYTGMDVAAIEKNLAEKKNILKWLVNRNMNDVNEIGLVMSKYYTGRLKL